MRRSRGLRQRRRRVQQVQKKWPQAQTGDRTQQPAQVVARGTADRLHRIAQRALQPAAVYPVIGLEVSDRRLDGLVPTQPALLLRPSGSCAMGVVKFDSIS